MKTKKIIIGTRGSQLSLVQTNLIKDQIQKISPTTAIEIQIITTKGDRDMNPVPLDSVGKGWFTKELDNALLEKRVDLAVHSLKDIPEELPEGLVIATIPKREDAREALVSKGNTLFEELKKGAVIGTDSTRRKIQILHKRPDLIVRSIRGNVNTRLVKLDNGNYDGIFLAVAGLKRLGLEKRITQYFAVKDIIPSPGQGALAIVIQKNNLQLFKLLQKLNHKETFVAVQAERTFSKELGGGCKMPVGAYAQINGSKIILHGIVGSLDGGHLVKSSLQSSVSTPEKLGKELAKQLIKKASMWSERQKYIVITRPASESKNMQKQLETLGLSPFFYPTITITKNKLTKKMITILKDIDSFDWIIFTSQNGVDIFLDSLKELGISLSVLKFKKIAAVGKQTAEALKKQKLPVYFIPSQFTTNHLVEELRNNKGEKILMLRANIATPLLIKKLKNKGALVTDIPIYKTDFTINNNKEFETLVANDQIQMITFTSPSTVEGFLKNTKQMHLNSSLLSLPVLSIGPVTTKALRKHGFQKIYTADIFTIEGMIAKMKESIL